MTIDLNLWFMFPVATAIAAIAMMAGIGGAILFAPFFMLVLKLDPVVALGAGLVIEFFGFSSGVIGYWRKKEINFNLVRALVIFTVPATVAGVFLGRLVPPLSLQIMIILLLLYLAYQFIFTGKKCTPKDPRCTGTSGKSDKWPPNWKTKLSSLLGGLLVGMISTGLGEINELNFLKRMRLPVAAASATSVFLVATSATAGSIIHGYFLLSQGDLSVLTDVISVLVFTVPGVIVGAQIGVFLANRINVFLMGKVVGVLFLVLAVLTLMLVI